jgi:hypothetical protein
MRKNWRNVVATAICSAILMTFTACDRDDTDKDGDEGTAVTYTGTAPDGKKYSLKIIEAVETYATRTGDAYTLTVTGAGANGTSKGTVSGVEGAIFMLAPSNASGETFSVMIAEKNIAVIVGTITFTDNKTMTAPGAFSINSQKQYTDTRGNSITIPGGAASCAVRVVSFTHGTPWTSDPRAMDPIKILGEPDYDPVADINFVTLGYDGVIVLEFGVYFTDGPGNDIYVFEIGPDVEATRVEISADLTTWIHVGDADGSLSGVDFEGKIPAGGKYKYVRLTDLRSAPPSPWTGADIDAVAIMHPTLQ